MMCLGASKTEKCNFYFEDFDQFENQNLDFQVEKFHLFSFSAPRGLIFQNRSKLMEIDLSISTKNDQKLKLEGTSRNSKTEALIG